MRNTRKLLLVSSLLAVAATLSACGGGGGGGVNPTPAPPPAPTPPPPPAPPPAPPPPSPPNTSLLNLTSSESFTNDAVTGTANFPKTGTGQTASAATATLTAAYDAATRGYTITVGGRSVTFLPTNLDAGQTTATVAVYSKTTGNTTDTLTLTKPGTSGRFTYEFVGGGYFQRTVDGATAVSGSIDAFSYGIETADASVPRTGLGQFAIDLVGAETVSNNVVGVTGLGTMQVDFASGAIVTHGRLDIAAPVPIGPRPNGYFSSEALLSSTTNAFSGNFRYNNFQNFSGQLNGRFFGPSSQEVGAAFHAADPTGNIIVGTIIGRRGALPPGNTTMTNLTSDAFFANNAATLDAVLQGTTGQNNGTERFSNTSATNAPLIVNYDAAQKGYTLIANGRSQYFLSERMDLGTVREKFGQPNWNTFFFSNYLAATQYVLGKRWYYESNGRLLLTDVAFGIETPDAALPRTGRAGYNIRLIGSAADGDLPNLTDFGGTGVLEADFGTGAMTASGNMEYREDYFIAGRAPRTATGTFSLTSTLSGTANAFAGTIRFDGIGTYSGPLNGRFYGPAAEEVGGAFSAGDGNGGVASGVLTGIKDPNIFASVPGLKELTQPTLLPNLLFGGASSGNISDQSYFQYDPATQTYSFYPSLQEATNAAALAYRFAPAQINAALSDAAFTAYDTTGPAGQFNATDTVAARIFNNSANNPRLVLTHTSFIDLTITSPIPGGGSRTSRNIAVFGVPTPAAQIPRSGTANYTGVAYGFGGAGGNDFSAVGTSGLTADFGASTFSATLNLDATIQANNVMVTLAPKTFTGSIVNGTTFGSAFDGFVGRFFGPNASEFGAAFNFGGTDPAIGVFGVAGVALGKRN